MPRATYRNAHSTDYLRYGCDTFFGLLYLYYPRIRTACVYRPRALHRPSAMSSLVLARLSFTTACLEAGKGAMPFALKCPLTWLMAL